MNESMRSPTQVLPDGLSIQTKTSFRKYCNRRKYNFGDDTLGGLYRKGNPVPETNGPVVTRHIGEPDDATRLKISQATRFLPDKLHESGLTVLERQKELFLERANALKAKLSLRKSAIPAEELKVLDDAVNSYACEGYEVIVMAFRVTSDRIDASSRKRSDGKFVTRKVIRRVLVKEKPTLAILEAITDSICAGEADPIKDTAPRAYQYKTLSELMRDPSLLRARARGIIAPDTSGAMLNQPAVVLKQDDSAPPTVDTVSRLREEAETIP